MLAGGRFGTNNLARAREFYDPIAALVGAVAILDYPNLVAYKSPTGGAFIIGEPFAGAAQPGNGNQLSLEAESRAAVDAVHAKAMELGGSDEGSPGIRGSNPDGFYGAYFRDPEGNKWVIYRMGPA